MESYVGTSGYVSFNDGAPESKRFTLWHKSDDPPPLLHGYIWQLRIDQEPLLDLVPLEGIGETLVRDRIAPQRLSS